VSDRHLRRVTETELGVSPIELAQTQRLLLANAFERHVLKADEVAFAAGLAASGRFNALFKSRYGLNPRALRRHADPAAVYAVSGIPAPLAWEKLLAYLRLRPNRRRIGGRHSLSRTVAIDDHQVGSPCRLRRRYALDVNCRSRWPR